MIMKKYLTLALISLAGLTMTARAQFFSFLDVDFTNATYTASAQWDDFDSPGGPNNPDVEFNVVEMGGPTSITDFNAYDTNAPGNGAFITSTGNIYTEVGNTAPTIMSDLSTFKATNLVFQIETLGSTLDLDSVRLNYDGESMAPHFTELVTSVVLGGVFGGIGQLYAFQWDLSDTGDSTDFSLLDAPEFTITAEALTTSMSISALRIDFAGADSLLAADFEQFVVPEPTTSALVISGFALLAYRRRRA